jgi:hypothetical protein
MDVQQQYVLRKYLKSCCRVVNPLFDAVYERQTARRKPHAVGLFYVARKRVEILR